LGELLLELNQLDSAKTHLEIALQQKPDDLHALIARARLALAQNEIESAQRMAHKAEDLAPGVRAVHEIQAQLHQRAGDRQAALRALELAAKLPDVPLPYDDPYASQILALRRDPEEDLAKARELLASERFNEAIELLRDALREHTTDPILPCELARAYAQINRFDLAHAVLEEAAEQHPDSAQVRLQRGVLYFLRAEYENAAHSFREAADRKPDYVQANFYLAKSLDKLGRLDDAISAFRATVRLQPTHAEAHADLGRLLLNQGKHAMAAEHLGTALRLAPDNEAIQKMHADAVAGSNSDADNSKSADEGKIERKPPE
jgi:tetratricopeptide (TPR) repeat protein